jgi:hypothetical protein
MPAKRPTSFTVFAVLSIVFGSLGLVCNACGLVSQAAMPALRGMQPKPAPGQPDPEVLQREFEAKLPGYQAYQWGTMGLSIILSTLLLVSGIGLLKMKAWSRWTCILYGVISILVQLAVMVYNVAYVGPATTELMNESMKSSNVTLPGGLVTGFVVFVALLGMTYAIILLIFAVRPRMGEQLATFDDSQLPDKEYYDEDYERQRREPPPDA